MEKYRFFVATKGRLEDWFAPALGDTAELNSDERKSFIAPFPFIGDNALCYAEAPSITRPVSRAEISASIQIVYISSRLLKVCIDGVEEQAEKG